MSAQQQSYPQSLAVEIGISPDAYHGGSDAWRDDSRALYSILRGSVEDSLQFLRETFRNSWAEYVLRPVGFVEWLAEQHATLYPQDARIRYRHRATGKYVSDEQAAINLRIRRESGHRAAFQSTTEEAIVCGNGTAWLRPLVRNKKFLGVRWMSMPVHTQAVDLGDMPETSEEQDVAQWWMSYPVKGSYEARIGMPKYGIARFTKEGAVWDQVHDGNLRGKPIWPMPAKGWIDDIPAVVIRRQPAARPGEFWARTRQVLLAQNRAVDLGQTDMADVVHMQGHGQWIGEGMTPEQAAVVKMGPKRIALTPQGAKLDAKSPGADFEGMRETAESYLAMALATNTVNADALFKDGSITALAKEVALWDRDEKRRVLVDTCAVAEQRAYDLTRAYYRAFNGGIDSLPDCIVEVDFPRREAPRDPLHKMQEAGWRIALGWGTPASELVRFEKGTRSIADVETEIDENRKKTVAQIGYMPQPPGLSAGAGMPATPSDSADAASAKPPAQVVQGAAAGQPAKPPALATGGATEDVAKTALNGAQVTALLEAIALVAERKLPAAAAREVILASFPIDPTQVDKMLGALKTFEPAKEEAPAAAAPKPPPVQP